MKTFRELLAESTKTYAVRVKIAGDLPEAFEKKLKDYMTKYEVVEFKREIYEKVLTELEPAYKLEFSK